MVGMYKQVQTNRREFTEKFVRGMYKKPQPEEYIQRVVAASLKMPSDSAVAASVSFISRADWRPALAKNRPARAGDVPGTAETHGRRPSGFRHSFCARRTLSKMLGTRCLLTTQSALMPCWGVSF